MDFSVFALLGAFAVLKDVIIVNVVIKNGDLEERSAWKMFIL